MPQVRLSLFQEVSVIQPELVRAVTFSQKYLVPGGLLLTVQFAQIEVGNKSEKEAFPGRLARVYRVYSGAGGLYPVSFPSPFLALA